MTTEGVQTEIIELTKLAAPRREPTKCVPQRRPPLGGPTNDTRARTNALEPTNGTPARIAAHEPTSATPARAATIDSANDASRRRAAFGEFLVENHVLDRYQLFRVLQLQDRMPGVRLGHCAVALGYAPRTEIEQLHVRFVQSDEAQIEDIDLESMTTDAFERDPEVDIQYRDVPR